MPVTEWLSGRYSSTGGVGWSSLPTDNDPEAIRVSNDGKYIACVTTLLSLRRADAFGFILPSRSFVHSVSVKFRYRSAVSTTHQHKIAARMLVNGIFTTSPDPPPLVESPPLEWGTEWRETTLGGDLWGTTQWWGGSSFVPGPPPANLIEVQFGIIRDVGTEELHIDQISMQLGWNEYISTRPKSS